MSKKPLLLIILDGFGYSPATQYNAIALADTPHLDQWFAHFPHALLKASGAAVGLPEGYIGNSEVGHLTIGAGRIILQPVTLINNAIYDGTFFDNPSLIICLEKLSSAGKTLHIMGLLSDAGIHSHIKYLLAFIKAAEQHHIKKIIIHPFLDGRDVPPQSATMYLTLVQQHIAAMPNVFLGSVQGRYYAMDRDNNWERTEQSYRVLTQEIDNKYATWQHMLEHYYAENITDEFMPPAQLPPFTPIQDGDGVIFFNVRPDRARQLTAAFCDPFFNHFPTAPLNLSFFITPVSYSKNLHTVVLFPEHPLHNTLKHWLVRHHKTIFSIAETEKYAHVTYFFSGGTEAPFQGETQILVPSLKVNYADYPVMSAPTITDTVINSLENNPCDFYLINYANPDMVGHTGNLKATIMAIECLDQELARLYDVAVKKMDGVMIITGDHGKAESMFDEHIQQPITSHTTNPVTFIMMSGNKNLPSPVGLTQLADITPFIIRIIQSL